jgi:hypothetical protein
VVALATTNTAAPAGAPSVAGLTATPLEAATTLVGAAIAVGAAPPGLTGGGIDSSFGAAAAKARKPRRTPPQQRLSYTPKHGFTTAMVHLRAGCEERLPLPASFVGTMGRNPPTSIMVEEGSGGQPLYLVEVLHDEQRKSYLTNGWTRFIDDYDLKCGLVPHLDPLCRVTRPLHPRRRHLRRAPPKALLRRRLCRWRFGYLGGEYLLLFSALSVAYAM